MQVCWGYVMAVGVRIVVFGCSFLVGLERNSRVTHASVELLATHLCCAFLCYVIRNHIQLE
jgi:hypothetical protein